MLWVCNFNSIKVRLELKTDASDFVIPENFNSIKVRLEHAIQAVGALII